jgi:2-polyprenyl-3-methyl-5-hydroxy-6-metoxy-1,4-benzoquinol methylase
MPGQISYYNEFGKQFENSILQCPEPEFWTTDYEQKGRVYCEIKDRVSKQNELASTYFYKGSAVLDIGCGFGRQAILLARQGYKVTGIDTSSVFIEIAKKLFERSALNGDFFCGDLLTTNLTSSKFSQVLVLDVLEHIRPAVRRAFFEKLFDICSAQAIVILSLPRIKQRFTSKINNAIRRRITQHLSYFRHREEHPYPIPGISEIIGLMKGRFVLMHFSESTETAFYVLQRIEKI